MKNSNSEENYLKAVFYLTYKSSEGASTSSLAKRLKTQASSVTDMLKKLADKSLLNYKKYQGAILTTKGKKIAIEIIRKQIEIYNSNSFSLEYVIKLEIIQKN